MLALVLLALFVLPPSQKRSQLVTPIERAALPGLLRQAHVAEFGFEPGRMRLGMAVAVIRWENGNGAKVYHHNLGNLGILDGGPYYLDSGGYYAVFATFSDGARSFWRHLAGRCAGALAWFDVGDSGQSAAALKRCGYFAAPLERYEAGLRRLYRLE